MSRKYNVVELFSGIGSQAKALKKIGFEINVQATCEWDMQAFIAYDVIHREAAAPPVYPAVKAMSFSDVYDKLCQYTLSGNGKEPMDPVTLHGYGEEVLKRAYTAILRNNNLVDITKVTGERMPDSTDILTYSFPCQDLSNVGAFHGYRKGIDKDSGSRSSLLWQVGRLLKEMTDCGKRLPRFLVMENVPTLLSDRHRGNFNQWISELSEFGYVSGNYELNARNFGIPQNRPRLLMVSVLTGDDAEKTETVRKYLKAASPESIISDFRNSGFYRNITVGELLHITQDKNSVFWQEALACNPNDTPSRRRIWEENPQLVTEGNRISGERFVRTITTKQDRNPNSGNIWFDSGLPGRANFRYLTPRECMLFMGFDNMDYDNLIANNPVVRKKSCLFPRDKIIRMAGNSIPVQLLEGFFWQIRKIEDLLG